MLLHYGEDTLVIGSDHDVGSHFEGSLHDTDDHWLASDVYEGLTWETSRSIASGDDRDDTHSEDE